MDNATKTRPVKGRTSSLEDASEQLQLYQRHLGKIRDLKTIDEDDVTVCTTVNELKAVMLRAIRNQNEIIVTFRNLLGRPNGVKR